MYDVKKNVMWFEPKLLRVEAIIVVEDGVNHTRLPTNSLASLFNAVWVCQASEVSSLDWEWGKSGNKKTCEMVNFVQTSRKFLKICLLCTILYSISVARKTMVAFFLFFVSFQICWWSSTNSFGWVMRFRRGNVVCWFFSVGNFL